jgi:hypothetical protein
MKILRNALFILGTILFISWTADNNCRKYFKGKWKYKNITQDSTYVIRTLEKQVEYTSKGKYYYEFKIKWLSSCKYQLTYIKTTSPKPAVINIGETLTVEIISINSSHMTYKTVFRDMQETDEMEKIK